MWGMEAGIQPGLGLGLPDKCLPRTVVGGWGGGACAQRMSDCGDWGSQHRISVSLSLEGLWADSGRTQGPEDGPCCHSASQRPTPAIMGGLPVDCPLLGRSRRLPSIILFRWSKLSVATACNLSNNFLWRNTKWNLATYTFLLNLCIFLSFPTCTKISASLLKKCALNLCVVRISVI